MKNLLRIHSMNHPLPGMVLFVAILFAAIMQGCTTGGTVMTPPKESPVALDSPAPTMAPGTQATASPQSLPEATPRVVPPKMSAQDRLLFIQDMVKGMVRKLHFDTASLPPPVDPALFERCLRESGLEALYGLELGAGTGSPGIELKVRLSTHETRFLQYARADLDADIMVTGKKTVSLSLAGRYTASSIDSFDAAYRSLREVLGRAGKELQGSMLAFFVHQWEHGIPYRIDLPPEMSGDNCRLLEKELVFLPRCMYAQLKKPKDNSQGAPYIEFGYFGSVDEVLKELEGLLQTLGLPHKPVPYGDGALRLDGI